MSMFGRDGAVRHAARRKPSEVGRTPWRVLLLATLPPTLVIVVAVALHPLVPVHVVFHDAVLVANSNGDVAPHYGLVSNLGVLAWAVAAGACLLAGLALRGRPERGFFLIGSALTIVLAADDLIRIHEVSRVLEAGMYAGYVVALAAYVLRYRGIVLGVGPGLLVLGIVGLGSSVVIDLISDSGAGLAVVVEDGAKLVGVAGWVVFHVYAAVVVLDRVLGAPARRAEGSAPPLGEAAPLGR